MSRKIAILFCFLTFAALLPAQSNFEWGVSVYPNISHRRLIAGITISEQQARELEERESARLSYSAGLLGGWRGERAAFRFGLNFMDTGFRTVREAIPADQPAPEGALERRLVFRNLNVEVPLELHFIHPFGNKASFSFMMGMSLSYNLKNYTDTLFYFGDTRQREQAVDQTLEYRPFNYAFQTGLSYDRKISDGLALFVQPTFQFWMRGVLKDTDDINRNLYSLGVKTGIRLLPPGE